MNYFRCIIILSTVSFITKKILLFLFLLSPYYLFSQTKDTNDQDLLQKFIQSRGVGIVSFDASNIKRFWTSNTVSSKDDTIIILPQNKKNSFESVPLKIQLVNVNEGQDCKVEVLTDTPEAFFSILNTKGKQISTSSPQEKFIQYHLLESTFHLADTGDSTFSMQFTTKKPDPIRIKAIVLSFAKNPNGTYLFSPGTTKIIKDNMSVFSLTGKQMTFTMQKMINFSNNNISTTMKIKNTGETAARVIVGFATYTKDHQRLDVSWYPLNEKNEILTVVSAEKGSNTILVDSYPTWKKNCPLALNVKEDMSDIPNKTILDSRIVEITKLDNGNAEIKLNKPLINGLEKGVKIRVHFSGISNIYIESQDLQPGEEKKFEASLKKDEIKGHSALFKQDVYYVKPMILSNSLDSKTENTITVSDGSITY